MSVSLSMLAGAGAQFFDNNGDPLSGGKLFTYAAGTSTPQATYTTVAGTTAHTNPIILDSAGRVPNGGEIWLTDTVRYKFVLQSSLNVLLGTFDDIDGNFTGMVNPMTTAGDIIVGLAGGAPSRLGIGSEEQLLTIVNNSVVWAPSSTIPLQRSWMGI